MEWKIILFVLPALFALTFGDTLMGSKDVDINDPEVQEALRVAVEEHNKNSNSMYLYKVQQVKKMEVQVIQGNRFKMTVIMAKTTCLKYQEPERCSFLGDPAHECTFTVWSRVWLHNAMVVSEECS